MAYHLSIMYQEPTGHTPTGPLAAFSRVWSRITGRRSIYTSGLTGDELAKLADGYGTATDTGERVSAEGAMALTAVQACVRLIATQVASLPLPVYNRLPNGGKERAPKHPLYNLLHLRPNPDMSSMTFRETLQAHLLLWGNAYAEVERDAAGRPRALWPIHPSRVTVTRANSRKTFLVLVDGQRVPLTDDEVLHIPGLSYDGLVGVAPIELARRAMGLAQATEKYGAKFFGAGVRPAGVLTAPGRLSDEAKKRLRDQWQSLYSGLDNSHKTPVLEEGMTWAAVGIPPEHAQFLETRKYQTAEIARIFAVPPHMIGDVERSTSWGSGIEQQNIGFLTYTLRPWLVRWEQVLNWELFGDRSPYFAEFLIDGLLRGDIASRTAALSVRFQNGNLNADEWREIENQNPLPDGIGQTYYVPLNMVPADLARAVAEKQAAPEPPPPAPAPAPEPDDDAEPEAPAPDDDRALINLPAHRFAELLNNHNGNGHGATVTLAATIPEAPPAETSNES